jgi:putative lysine transport system substrate-binding protein
MKKTITTIIMIALVAMTAFAGGQQEGTKGNTLRVGMECAYAPYNWAQSDSSNDAVPIKGSSDYAYGYDVMMAKYIAEELGMDLEIVKLDWDSLPVAVQSGSIDCGICGQSITSERLQTLDFSTPYYYASIVALTSKSGPFANAQGVSDLAGAVCTSQLNTIWYDICLPQIPGAKILTALESAPAMLVSLNSGVSNLVVTDQPTALAACMAYPSMTMLDFSKSNDDFKVSEEEINIGISIRKGNSALLEKINAALAKLTPEDFVSMMNEAIAAQPLAN